MFSGISRSEIDELWSEIEPWIATACKTSGNRYLASDIRRFLNAGEMQLWVYRHEGDIILTCVTEIVSYPQSKYALIRIATGKNRSLWQSNIHVIEAWAKSLGCYGIETIAREGWWRVLYSKIPGWKKTHTFIEKELQ